ncbi:MAG: hypothetical protein AAFZ63_07710 [Bacteroidota bacterium]
MPNSTIEPWIADRILGFFNTARTVDDVLDGTIQDDPSDGPGRTMGRTLAARILRNKTQLPRRRFTDFQQLDDISGVGPGTIQDLVYSFGTTAAESFQNKMYDDNVIYRENWPLEFFRFKIEDQGQFNEIVGDEVLFRTYVCDRVAELCEAREVAEADSTAMLGEIEKAYIDTYNNSTPAPAYAMALWFYEFDADNWFSWERIQEQTEHYINHHMASTNWEMELRMFRGVQQRGIIPIAITPTDLPVMVNWPEQVVTIWFSTLYD